MGIFNTFKKMFGSLEIDEQLDKQLADYNDYIGELAMFGDVAKEMGCDFIPGAQGAFGSVNNPVPVNGVIGEFAYLNRLRARSGVGFMFHRLGSRSSSVTSHTIDIYSLVSVDAKEWYTVHLCPYYPRRSVLAPYGLTLQNWSDLEEPVRLMIKFPMWGTNSMVSNFPYGLPEEIERTMNSISSGLGNSVAKRIRATIQSKPNWKRPD
jgi:hypothetical protein